MTSIDPRPSHEERARIRQKDGRTQDASAHSAAVAVRAEIVKGVDDHRGRRIVIGRTSSQPAALNHARRTSPNVSNPLDPNPPSGEAIRVIWENRLRGRRSLDVVL